MDLVPDDARNRARTWQNTSAAAAACVVLLLLQCTCLCQALQAPQDQPDPLVSSRPGPNLGFIHDLAGPANISVVTHQHPPLGGQTANLVHTCTVFKMEFCLRVLIVCNV
jgi:hypothetical protein